MTLDEKKKRKSNASTEMRGVARALTIQEWHCRLDVSGFAEFLSHGNLVFAEQNLLNRNASLGSSISNGCRAGQFELIKRMLEFEHKNAIEVETIRSSASKR